MSSEPAQPNNRTFDLRQMAKPHNCEGSENDQLREVNIEPHACALLENQLLVSSYGYTKATKMRSKKTDSTRNLKRVSALALGTGDLNMHTREEYLLEPEFSQNRTSDPAFRFTSV